MKRRSVLLGALALTVTSGAAAAAAPGAARGKRVVVYYQTQYANGSYVSPLGLTRNGTGVTDVLVAAVHLNDIKGPYAPVHVNDDPPEAAKYDQMWRDLKEMQRQGVHVLAMVGGAAPGSFTRLDTEFDTYYPLLRDFIRRYGLDGVDLDVEERMSLAGIERVIDALRADFGPGFLITLAPVGSALSGGGNLSGFDYERLYRERGGDIAWFNAQFYNGWGSMASTASYAAVIRRGLIPASKVIAGTLTDPSNGGSGYVAPSRLKATIRSLVARYPDMGGVMGWEYFNSQPGGTAQPWRWAAEVSSALGRGR
ncbi:glycosyl hydrolase family 18 protein [Streptomyces flavofungini]|uniref:glycosyl hydrolase family 18 protein n=1 Tax=Streptomyces flavofungini TaxID=68200 RepID=UPI0025B275D5|nr:glycosyl hydrolase family 18 protein [Streptomyces flavofungini]WJV44791.1 glycosyl hydrolase family 18 protein [Streptomyces flavofungini]